MSFKTALASCWDICKRNCTMSTIYYPFFYSEATYFFPKFNFKVYSTYSDSATEIPFPYSEKLREKGFDSPTPRGKYKGGLTEPEDKLVSSFIGWVFVILEVLFWSMITLGKALLAIFLFLGLTLSILGAPIFLVFEIKTVSGYGQLLKEFVEALGSTLAFTVLALLQVPYLVLKTLIRIPAGVVVAVREIVSPSPVAIPQPITSSLPASQPIVNSDELNQSQYSRVLYPSPLTPAIQPHAQGWSGFESDEEDSSEERPDSSDEDGDMENQRYDQDDYARNRSYMDEQFSLIYELFMASEIERRCIQLLSQHPFMNPDAVLLIATIEVMQMFPQGVGLLASPTQANSHNDDLQTTIDISFNQRPPSFASDPIQSREPKANWCEGQLDKLGFTKRPERYTCVISKELMNPPFLVSDGNLYDEDSIEAYFEIAGRKSPITREMPFTHNSGIALETVKNEIVSFMIAVRANYHLDKIQGKEEENSGTKAVLKIAEDIEKKASTLHEEINQYVKERHTTERLTLAKKMINDQAMISTTVIAKAWDYIKALTGARDNPSFSTMSPTNAMAHFFLMIKEMDASFDNLIINVLREAMLEEQKVSQAYDATWISQPGCGIAALGDKLSIRLKQYLPDEKPQNLDDVVEKIQEDKNISDKALQYALLLINSPEKAVNFDQFEPEKKERLITSNAFLDACYAPENALLKPVFLMTLKEIILKEEMVLKQSSNFSEKVCFGSVLQQAVTQENENRDLEVVGEVSFANGM